MTTTLNLEPAIQQMTSLLAGVTDDQLGAPTPCPRYTLGDLVEHVDGLSVAFTFAAAKRPLSGGSQAPSGDASRLGDDWRTRIPTQLTELAQAWRDPEAWAGMTQAGGVDLPGSVAGVVALNELVVHGWDISRASGQPFAADPHAISACMQFVSMSAPDQRANDAGLFGPVVEVAVAAPPLAHLIGLAGRNPSWPEIA
jgi:uncharacterized protein (TIGR03086 family)